MNSDTQLDEVKINQNRRKNIKQLSLAFWITFVLCIAYIIQDIFTRDDFFDKSNEVTLHVMENTGYGYEWFNRRISTLSMLLDAVMIAYVFWITPRQMDGLYLIICTALSLFQMTFLKSLYRDPRPYFVDLDIKTDECGPEFGNPSGHGVNNLVMVYVAHYIADNDCFYMLIKDEAGKLKLHQRRFWINLIGLILCILIGWARVCLGMHSLNQVLLGWVFGILWIIVFLCVFYRRYRYYWSQIIKEEGLTVRKKVLAAIVVIVYAFITGMCVLVYEQNKKHFDIPEMWIKGIIQTCKKPFDDEMFHKSLYHKTFSDMGVYGVMFGIMLGYIFMKGSYDEKKLTENYAKAPKKIILLRVVSDIILLAISFGIPWISVQFIDKTQVYPRFFIGFNLASILAGFALVVFRSKFFKAFRCQLEGDMNYQILNSNKKVVILVEDGVQEQSSTNDSSNQITPLKNKSDNLPMSNSKIASPDPERLNSVQVTIQTNNIFHSGHTSEQKSHIELTSNDKKIPLQNEPAQKQN